MSQVLISYDTVNKTLDISVDGKKLKNVYAVHACTYENYEGKDESHIEITQMESDENSGMYKKTCIYASHQEERLEPVVDLAKLQENISKAMGLK